jgi:hypothetical protein
LTEDFEPLMPEENPLPELDAAVIAKIRDILPTSMGTAEIRERIAAGILARSVFSARTTHAGYLSVMKELLGKLAAGDIGIADVRVTLLQTLQAIGYTPEGGFPEDEPGTVPPAVKGTLQDLSSFRRLDLIVRTQEALMAGAGEKARGSTPDRLEAAPCWELIRMVPVKDPRNYTGNEGSDDGPRARWIIAGGIVTTDEDRIARWQKRARELAARQEAEIAAFSGAKNQGNPDWVALEKEHDGQMASLGDMPALHRMIAPKGDPVWGELGSSGNFDDALNVDHPPFYFNSGMGWKETPADECRVLGITASDGTPLDDFLASQPETLSGTQPLPRPRMSVRDVDPGVLDALRKSTGAEPAPGKPGMVDYSDLLEQSVERARKSYEARG